MSFSVYFANSAKPENSTKKFSTTGITPYNCTMKKGCSVLNPVIEFQVSYTDFATLSTTANVAYIGSLGRYYFVTDWKFDGVLAICYLSVDVLATYWDNIKLLSFYVTRSAYLTNRYIVDTEYPASAHQRSHYYSTNANPFQPPSVDFGCYVVGILSRNGGVTGCVEYYVMSYVVFVSFMNKVFNISNYGTLGTTGTNNDTYTSDLAEAIINPLQYISSIMWFPWSVSNITTLGITDTTSTIAVGYTNISMGVNVNYFDGLYARYVGLLTFQITHHPDHNNGNSFLNLSPYGEYRLDFYPFGNYAIDGTYLQNHNYLYALWSVDLRTGRGVMNVGTEYSGTGQTDWLMPTAFLTAEAQVGVPIPTSTIQTMIPDMGVVGNALAVASGNGLFTGLAEHIKQAFQSSDNPVINKVVAGAFESAVDATGSLIDDVGSLINTSGIGSAILQTYSSPNMTGTQGSISLYPKENATLHCWFMGRSDLDNTHKGSPLCSVVQLSTLSGFTKCSSAVAQIQSATFSEKRKIENFLNTGFYIET